MLYIRLAVTASHHRVDCDPGTRIQVEAPRDGCDSVTVLFGLTCGFTSCGNAFVIDPPDGMKTIRGNPRSTQDFDSLIVTRRQVFMIIVTAGPYGIVLLNAVD